MFFETSSDAECDPDLASKQLEQIAWHLGQLSIEEQREFRAFAERVATSDGRPDMRARMRVLVDGLLSE